MDKTTQRKELQQTIWKMADGLHGNVNVWEFTQNLVCILFYRYLSEYLTSYINRIKWDSGETNFNYAELKDSVAENDWGYIKEIKGFFILPSELFFNVLSSYDEDINLSHKLENIFKNIEDLPCSNDTRYVFKGIFDNLNMNSSRFHSSIVEKNKKLLQFMNNVESIKIYDLNSFGEAFDFIIDMYISYAGKRAGCNFTAHELSELLARIAIVEKIEINKVYDPACGSGSLLLKFAKVLGKENVHIGFYGQERNLTSFNLCKINMFLHGISYKKFNVETEDTLIKPLHKHDEPFDVIVSNPSFNIKWEGSDNPLLKNDYRFSPAGVLAPKSKADLAFVMHSLSWLNINGIAVILCANGAMFRGGAEQKIRKYLIDNNFIDCIIQMPNRLFYDTGIASCIMVIKKSKLDNKVLFIDASKEYKKVKNKNKLLDNNIQNILNYYINKEDVEYISKISTNKEIEGQDYNLSVSRYIEQEEQTKI